MTGMKRHPSGRYSVTSHRTVQSLHVRDSPQGDPLFNPPCMVNDGSPNQLWANFLIANLTDQAIKYPPGSANALTPGGTVDRTALSVRLKTS